MHSRAPPDEPGTAFVIHGRVFLPDGRTPAPAIQVLAYHRDIEGFDFGPGDDTLNTWRLQGWVQTDAQGRFEYHTIRPGTDWMLREAAHIHFNLVSEDYGRQWNGSFYMTDDPLVTDNMLKESNTQGRFGNVREVTIIDAVQHIDVALRLKPEADF